MLPVPLYTQGLLRRPWDGLMVTLILASCLLEGVMALILVLLAEGSIDSLSGSAISGGAGWVGAGLLGLVLGWLLLVRIPAMDKITADKDKQLQVMIEAKDTQQRAIAESRDGLIKEITGSFAGTLKELSRQHDEAFAIAEKDRRADFKNALETVVGNCQRESDILRTMIDKKDAEVTSTVMDVRRTMEDLRELILSIDDVKFSTRRIDPSKQVQEKET